jgi:hypothetical protein
VTSPLAPTVSDQVARVLVHMALDEYPNQWVFTYEMLYYSTPCRERIPDVRCQADECRRCPFK